MPVVNDRATIPVKARGKSRVTYSWSNWFGIQWNIPRRKLLAKIRTTLLPKMTFYREEWGLWLIWPALSEIDRKCRLVLNRLLTSSLQRKLYSNTLDTFFPTDQVCPSERVSKTWLNEVFPQIYLEQHCQIAHKCGVQLSVWVVNITGMWY